MLSGLLMDRFAGDNVMILDEMAKEVSVAAEYTECLEAERCELNARVLLQEQINYEISRK
jgi:hypothetical protein